MKNYPSVEAITANPSKKATNKHHLVWIQPGLIGALDQATWLETAREIRQRDWEVTLITAGSRRKIHINDVEVECIPTWDVYLLRQIAFHLQLLLLLVKRWNKIDILLFHQMTAPWVLPLKLLRQLRKKSDVLFVLDTRTIPMELKHRSSMRDRIRFFYFHLLMYVNKYVSDGQTAITERLAKQVGIPEEHLWGTWPSGVNLDSFSPEIQNRKWPSENDPVCLIYIGALHYERNLMPLVHAVLRANKEGMNISLTLIGMGTEQWALDEIAQQNKLYISVFPPIPHTEIPPQLAKAHIGVLPFPDLPQFRVSSPIKLFEYMASGLPIFATRIDCHTDVIRDGKYVFWAEDGSEEGLFTGIRQIWEHRSSLQQMSLESLKAAESWTWEKSAERLIHALEYGLELQKRDWSKKISWKTRFTVINGQFKRK